MNQHEIDLTLALYYEHQQRTGHDIMKALRLLNMVDMGVLTCNVCLHLRPLMESAEKAQCPPEPKGVNTNER